MLNTPAICIATRPTARRNRRSQPTPRRFSSTARLADRANSLPDAGDDAPIERLPYTLRVPFHDLEHALRALASQAGVSFKSVLHAAHLTALSRLTDLGVMLRDLQTGLVDFHAMMNDRVVLLCWRRGEESIMHWHSVESGFAGRQPIL